MKKLRQRCSGVTMSELLIVLVIMSILTTLGVSGLQRAVANTRVKDAAFNVSAYLERAANEAQRRNTRLCVKKDPTNSQKLITYTALCGSEKETDKIDSLILDSPNRIIDDLVNGAAFAGLDNWAVKPSGSVGAQFTPHTGRSSAPVRGYFAVQYGGQGIYGAALKTEKKNAFIPMMKYDEGSWFKL